MEQELADGNSQLRANASGSQELDKEIAELAKIPPLYSPTGSKNVAISEYLLDFIKENPQSHTRVRLNRLLLEAAYPKEIAAQQGRRLPGSRDVHRLA